MSLHRAGFVNIIGLPNVGKSTLLNALLDENLSIVTPKAQTTRQRILGIVNGDDYQLIFTDTPGFINEPAYELQRSMNALVSEALTDADVLLLVTDKFQKEEEEKKLVEIMQNSMVPGIVIINKLDLCSPAEAGKLVDKWQAKLPACKVIALSAISNLDRNAFIQMIAALLPESPPYYDKDELTDRNVRFYVAEIIREKIFLNYNKEIPYSCQVEMEAYKEEADIDKIKCSIFVERESQKAIVIGRGGEALKKLGTESRKAIEAFVGKKVFLDLVVKVKTGWRNNEQHLKKFGF